MARLRRELENLLQALAWCSQTQDGTRKELALAKALQSFWFYSGLLQLGYEVTRAAAERASIRNRDRVYALIAAASLAFGIGKEADGNAHLAESLSIARELSDALLEAKVKRQLAYAAGERGEADTACSMEDVLSVARTRG